MAKILVLGIGNPIRHDDGVAIEIVRRLREKIDSEGVDIKETCEAGLNLLDLMIDYERLLIVDSIQTEGGRAGDIYRFTQKELKSPSHLQFSHNTGIPALLRLAEKMKLSLSEEITFYAIEIEKGNVFGEGLTENVEEAVPRAVELIAEEIRNHRSKSKALQKQDKEVRIWRCKSWMR